MFVGTIHAFCLDLLKTEVPEYMKFGVLNEVQQTLFIDRHSSKSGLTTSTDLDGRKLVRFRDTGRYVQALSILREAAIDEKSLAGCSVFKCADDYRALLEEKRYLDYSGILENAAEVLISDDNLGTRFRAL
jgi:DNA helicase-2/ATP-dependent DNA helicase PcrA